LLAGTDAPSPGTAHGASIHRGHELLVKAGLTPSEALTAATSAPAIGLDDDGSIARAYGPTSSSEGAIPRGTSPPQGTSLPYRRGDRGSGLSPGDSGKKMERVFEAWIGETMRGKIKWFNNSKGYGFIGCNDGPDVFVHYSAIEGDGYRTLKEDDLVDFDIVQGPKGRQASNVTKTERATD
jgi:CspA family cold shock protein